MFAKMIASIVRRRAPAARAQAPKRAAHRLSRAVAETLESRWLLSASAYTLNQIGLFGLNDTGTNPLSTLVADAAGNLFGTASQGGAYGVGTVFEIPAGTSTIITLASFNGTDGADPQAGVTLDSAGNLYGTTNRGGPSDDGTVFEIAKGSTTVTTLASFNVTNGLRNDIPTAGVTLDAAGDLYGTTPAGGSSDRGTVFEIAKGSASVTTLASFDETNGRSPLGGVTLDAAGNLYGTTAGDNGTVFEIANGSSTITTLASFNLTNGESPYGGVTLDSAGNLYGTTFSGGDANGDGTVFEIAKGSASVTTLALFNGTNGASPVAGVTLDAAGNLYGTTQQGGPPSLGEGTVFKIAKGSRTITTLAFNGKNGALPSAGVTLDAAGNIYGTTQYGGASNDGTVFEIAKGSRTITNLASLNATNGADPQAGVTLDAASNLYGTANTGGASGNGTVFEIAKGTNAVTTLASFNGTNGSNPLAGVTLDSAGNLYGTTSSVFGGYGTVFEIPKGTNTVTTLASFNGTNGNHPLAGVTLDSAGNLYGTTQKGGARGGGTVFEIAKGSNVVTTLASFNGTNGANPYGGVTLDAAGNLYGTTSSVFGGHGTVFEIAKGTNTVTTLASFNGTNGSQPLADVTLDAAGNLYGTTSAGGLGGLGTVFEIARGTNTIATLGSFNGTNGADPRAGVTFDALGNLYGTTIAGGVSGAGVVFKLSPAIPGDANGDGKVDFADLLVLAQNYGKSSGAVWTDGDFNGDGNVGFDDLLILAQNYGAGSTSPPSVRSRYRLESNVAREAHVKPMA